MGRHAQVTCKYHPILYKGLSNTDSVSAGSPRPGILRSEGSFFCTVTHVLLASHFCSSLLCTSNDHVLISAYRISAYFPRLSFLMSFAFFEFGTFSLFLGNCQNFLALSSLKDNELFRVRRNIHMQLALLVTECVSFLFLQAHKTVFLF